MSVGRNLRVGLGAGRRRSMVTARPVRYVAGVALIATGYYVFAQGGEALLLTGPAGAFWPAAGSGDRGALPGRPALVARRPARGPASLSATWSATAVPPGTALAEAAGDMRGVLVAVIILRRLVGPRAAMDRLAARRRRARRRRGGRGRSAPRSRWSRCGRARPHRGVGDGRVLAQLVAGRRRGRAGRGPARRWRGRGRRRPRGAAAAPGRARW